MNDRPELTANELIGRLIQLPPDTIVTTTEHDSEYMHTYQWSISGVAENGTFQKGNLINSWGDWHDDPDWNDEDPDD